MRHQPIARTLSSPCRERSCPQCQAPLGIRRILANAKGSMSHPLIFPMAAHVALAALLYALLTVARAPSVWGLGRRPDGSNPWARAEPRISANLSNQFEWPLFFHVACLLLLERHAVETFQVWLAWAFVAGRLAHTYVQIFTTNVRLRGIVFTLNFVAVLVMWLGLVLANLGQSA